jgi:hypothetical protein
MAATEVPAELRPYARPCQHCSQHVVQAWDYRLGKEKPVTAEPQTRGNLSLALDKDGLVVSTLTRGQAEAMTKAGVPLYLHHALTCAKTRDWYVGSMPSRSFAPRTSSRGRLK